MRPIDLNDSTDAAVNDELLKIANCYNLTYHMSYLERFLDYFDPKGKDVLEVGGALPRELVIDYLDCNSWTCVESPGYDAELGEANQQTLLKPKLHDSRYSAVLCDIEDFGENNKSCYDAIFSIACFEHIARLPEALTAMHSCLKPGGVLFTMFSPIWSCWNGHHLFHLTVPSEYQVDRGPYDILLPWEHLIKNRSQLHIDLSNRYDKEFADEVIYQTFNSPHINRYFTEDYIRVVSHSPFLIEEMSATFPAPVPPEVQKLLERTCQGYSLFSNSGIRLRLRKT